MANSLLRHTTAGPSAEDLAVTWKPSGRHSSYVLTLFIFATHSDVCDILLFLAWETRARRDPWEKLVALTSDSPRRTRFLAVKPLMEWLPQWQAPPPSHKHTPWCNPGVRRGLQTGQWWHNHRGAPGLLASNWFTAPKLINFAAAVHL